MIEACTGNQNQAWAYHAASGEITGHSGLCLDAAGQRDANGTALQLWSCSGGTNQQWNLDLVGGSDAGNDQAVPDSGGNCPPTTSTVDLSSETAPVVLANRTYQFVYGTTPMTWTLNGQQAGTIKPNGLYHSPTSIPVVHSMAGCPVLPNDSIFNVPINTLPLESHSAAWTDITKNVDPGSIEFALEWGTNVTDATTPVIQETFAYTPGNNGPFSIPARPDVKRQNGSLISSGAKTFNDHHIFAVRKDTCAFYDVYDDSDLAAPSGGYSATSGVMYPAMGFAIPNGTTQAANLLIAPVTIHLSEMLSGVITHPVRFTLPGGFIQSGRQYWPSNSTLGSCPHCDAKPPYGARYRLKATFDTSSFSPMAKTVLVALQQYGMILADAASGSPEVSASTDVSEDQDALDALGEISGARINLSQFEVVDESSLMIDSASSRVNPNNPYVKPASFATITGVATDGTNKTVTAPLALQGVAVGLSSPTMTILSGTPPYALQSWVNGTCNQEVQWSLVSGPGSVSVDGSYAAPANVDAPTAALLKVTSSADPGAASLMYVTVLPAGANPAGSIRIDVGNTDRSRLVKDGDGNDWLWDVGSESGSSKSGGDYPAWADRSNPQIGIYQTFRYTWGTDMVYTLVVPNGQYNVRLMFGEPYNGCQTNCTPFNPTWHAPLALEAQGKIENGAFDFGAAIGHAVATPSDANIPATVTDNRLVIAVRGVAPDGALTSPGPILNGLEITPR